MKNPFVSTTIRLSLLAAACLLSLGCASSKQTFDCSGDPCGDAKAVCSEARDARADYDRLPPDERKELISAVNTYVEHCEDAEKRCKKCSGK